MNFKPLTFDQFKSEIKPHLDFLFGGSNEINFDECGSDSNGYFSASSGLVNVAYYRSTTGYYKQPWHIKIFGRGERYGETIEDAVYEHVFKCD